MKDILLNQKKFFRWLMNRMSSLLAEMAHHRILWLFLVAVSIMSIWDLTGLIIIDYGNGVKIGYILTFAMLKATTLTLLYLMFRNHVLLRDFFYFFLACYTLVSLINFVSYILYGFGISRKLIMIFAQTTLRETLEFLPGLLQNIGDIFISWQFFAMVVAVFVVSVVLKRIKERTFTLIAVFGSGIACIAFLVYCMTFSVGRSAHLIFARIAKYSKEVIDWNNQFIELSKNKRPLPETESVSSTHLAKTLVVVIGESASRRHWSIYGYQLPTNVLLEAKRDSLIVLSDVVSSSITTAGNMERILSFKEDDTIFNDGLEYPLLVDYFNEADYKTFWLSNQERIGQFSSTAGVMVMNADVIKYVGVESMDDAIGVKHDEILFPYFEEVLRDSAENKVIFLHLMGSHVEYKHRYPATFNFFNGKNEIDEFRYEWLNDKMAQRRAEYDNSIRYTDYILSRVIEKTSEVSEPAMFLYFSDHGENVYDSSSFSGRDDTSAEIPFIIYANKPYRLQNQVIIEGLERSKTKPFSSANVAHLLLSLTGSKYSRYESRLDLISPDYEIRPRYVDEIIWPLEHVGKPMKRAERIDTLRNL